MTNTTVDGKVVVFCDVKSDTQAPVTFCKCAGCCEARQLFRYHKLREGAEVVVRSSESWDGNASIRYIIAENIRTTRRLRGRRIHKAWHAAKAARRAGPFNGIKGLR